VREHKKHALGYDYLLNTLNLTLGHFGGTDETQEWLCGNETTES